MTDVLFADAELGIPSPLVIAAYAKSKWEPAPQGSKTAYPIWSGEPCRACGQKHFVKSQLVESSRALPLWRRRVEVSGLAAMNRANLAGRPLGGPIALSVIFTLQRPSTHFRSARLRDVLKPDAPRYPDGDPDTDKLARAVGDALTGVVWRDDAQLVEYRRLAKFWAGEDPDGEGLKVPGVRIAVWRMR